MNTLLFGFEKLIVWQKSKELTIEVYKATEFFPKEEKYTLIAQIRRCAVSIPSNIAEGTSRKSNKDKKRFYTIAYGSLMELINQLIIAKELNFINEEKLILFKQKGTEIAKMISGLKNAL